MRGEITKADYSSPQSQLFSLPQSLLSEQILHHVCFGDNDLVSDSLNRLNNLFVNKMMNYDIPLHRLKSESFMSPHGGQSSATS